VLIDKTSERPAWSPADLTDVSDAEIMRTFFSADSPYLSSVPKLTVPEYLSTAKEKNPMRYALPTEQEIESMVLGSHYSSGKSGIKMEELVSKFEDLRPGKLGVKEKVLEVAKRKCEIVDNSDGNFQWLKWRH
jgi:3-hydroxyisobutyryl-CoA hydrolase